MNTPRKLQPKKGPIVALGTVAVAVLALLGSPGPTGEGGQRLVPYLDSVGIPTACTGVIGPAVTARWKAHTRFTKDECDTMDQTYVLNMLRKMTSCVPADVAAEMNLQQMTAFAHWSYNTGNAAFCGNTTLHRTLVAKDWEGSCKAMGKWTFVTDHGVKKDCRHSGKLCPGIVLRREFEVKMCLDALE